MDAFGRMGRDAGEYVGEPFVRIHVVLFAGCQERVDDGRTLSRIVRAGK